MNTIIIEGPERALAAGGWATQHIKQTWSMDVDHSPFSNYYAFKFSNEQDATYFALKWR